MDLFADLIDFWLYLLGEHHGKNLEKMEWLIIIFPIHKGDFDSPLGLRIIRKFLGFLEIELTTFNRGFHGLSE